MTTWSLRPLSTAEGTVVERTSSMAGKRKTGSARNIITVPMVSIVMMSRFMKSVSQGASDPNPVVVNVSTTICSERRKERGSPSKASIPYWYASV